MIYLELFYTFFIIGLFGFGGGYGMLSLIQTETVVNHHWLSSAEFTNIVAVITDDAWTYWYKLCYLLRLYSYT